MRAHVLRLMSYMKLSRPVLARLGPEDCVSLDFATRLRIAAIEGRLHAAWTHPANELAGQHGKSVGAAVARAIGLIPGTPDYLFLWRDGSAALEAKSETGGQRPNQKDFAAWCADHGVPYHIFRSADEGEAILRNLGILT